MKKHSHRRFQVLLALILLLFAGYTGFWFYAIGEAKAAFAALVASEQARGNTLTYASAEWGGFPIRLGVDLTDVNYAAGDITFRSDTARVEVLPWQPTKGLARAEGNTVLTYRDANSPEQVELRPGMMLASIAVTWDGMLDNLGIGFHETAVKGVSEHGKAFDFKAGYLQFDARYAGITTPAPGSTVATTTSFDSYQVAFSADRADLGAGFEGLLGPRISQIRIAAWLKNLPLFSKGYRPLDWDSLVTMLADMGTSAEIARADVDWGGVAVRSTGLLTLDDAHRPAGKLDVKVTGLAKMVDIFLKAGVLEGNAGALALADGTPVPLNLANGEARFGPFRIGSVGPID